MFANIIKLKPKIIFDQFVKEAIRRNTSGAKIVSLVGIFLYQLRSRNKHKRHGRALEVQFWVETIWNLDTSGYSVKSTSRDAI